MLEARDLIEGRYRKAVFLLGFIILAVLVRLPFINIVNDDEAFYSVLAQRWLNSDWLYSKTFDVKPPMIFAVLAAFQSVLGMQFLTIKIIEMVSVGVSAYGVWRILELFEQKKSSDLGCCPDSRIQSIFVGRVFSSTALANDVYRSRTLVMLQIRNDGEIST